MKNFAVLMLSIGLALPGSALAIGAIAIDEYTGKSKPAYGYAIGKDSKREARETALMYCREYGGTHCKVIVWFESCGAVAVSRDRHGYGYGRTKAIAAADALEMCEETSCNLIVAECE